MRWGEHLVLGSIVGILLVAIWEIYTSNILSKFIMDLSGGADVGLVLAILLIVIIVLWGIASEG